MKKILLTLVAAGVAASVFAEQLPNIAWGKADANGVQIGTVDWGGVKISTLQVQSDSDAVLYVYESFLNFVYIHKDSRPLDSNNSAQFLALDPKVKTRVWRMYVAYPGGIFIPAIKDWPALRSAIEAFDVDCSNWTAKKVSGTAYEGYFGKGKSFDYFNPDSAKSQVVQPGTNLDSAVSFVCEK